MIITTTKIKKKKHFASNSTCYSAITATMLFKHRPLFMPCIMIGCWEQPRLDTAVSIANHNTRHETGEVLKIHFFRDRTTVELSYVLNATYLWQFVPPVCCWSWTIQWPSFSLHQPEKWQTLNLHISTYLYFNFALRRKCPNDFLVESHLAPTYGKPNSSNLDIIKTRWNIRPLNDDI